MALDCRSFALYVIKNPRAVALLRRHLLYGNLPHSPLVRTADLDGGESGVDARHSCCSSVYIAVGGAVLLEAISISPF